MMFKIFLLPLVLLANPAYAASAFTGTVSHVTDGDTLWVRTDSGKKPHKLRIHGIDAPEICQSGGENSRAVLAQRVLHQRVQVVVKAKDVYGRGVALIRLNGRDVGAQMVLSGQAWSYRWQRSQGPYALEEATARNSRRGLFASGQAVLPRDFRKRHGSCYAPR